MTKYKKIIITVVIMGLGIIGLALFTQSQTPQDTGESSDGSNSAALAAEINQYDFGEISMARGDVSYEYKIKNSGAEPLVITKIYTSCMCTVAELRKEDSKIGPFGMPGHGGSSRINETLNPGEEAVIKAVFDPAAHGPAGVGFVERIIYIEHKEGKILELHFTATVIP